MENILVKCWILGLSKSISVFDKHIEFILRFLNRHIHTAPPDELSFGKIYHFRDCEKILSCFLPFFGYHDDSAVLHIARKRIDILFQFTRQKRYDIYVDGSKLKVVKKEWQPYIINPDFYADGHIALPDMHDYLLFAGLLPYLSHEEKVKAEIIVKWLFDEGYSGINHRYGFFYAHGGSFGLQNIVESFCALGYGNDPRLSKAWNILNSKKTLDGKYILNGTLTKSYLPKERVGKPSKWVTFYAMLANKEKLT